MKTNFYSVNAASKSRRPSTSRFLGFATVIVLARTKRARQHIIPFLGLALLSITTGFTVNAIVVYPANDGFEQPDLGSGPLAYAYGPFTAGWTFSGNAGLAANGSDFNLFSAVNGNHNGVTSTIGQAALLQGGDGTLAGGFWQTLTLPFSGQWALNFSLEGRNAQDGANGVNVFLDGVQVGGTLFPFALGEFVGSGVELGFVNGGSHTIGFAGTIGSGDHTTFVENVNLGGSAAPDSGSTLALLLGSVGAILGLNFFVRRWQEA